MKKNLLLSASILLLLSACSTSNIDVALFGTWERQATYVNGSLEHEAPATLKISAKQYTSRTRFCTTSGLATSFDDTLAVSMKDSDCPSPLLLPFVIDYTYELSEDGQQLDLVTQEIREVYVKK